MAMNFRLLCPLAFSALSCIPDLQSNSHDHQLFYGSIRNVNTGATLLTFCQGLGVDRSDVIVFSAHAGSIVEEEVLIEGRKEQYHGGMPPERSEAFWCSAEPEVYLRPINYWSCLRAAAPDPPATILTIQ